MRIFLTICIFDSDADNTRDESDSDSDAREERAGQQGAPTAAASLSSSSLLSSSLLGASGRSSVGARDSVKKLIIQPSSITIGKVIGRGGCGVVRRAQMSGVDVILKGLHCRPEPSDREFWHEASMLALVRHPRVVQYYGVVCLPEDAPAAATTLLPSGSAAAAGAASASAATRLYLVMEFAPGGSIADALANRAYSVARKFRAHGMQVRLFSFLSSLPHYLAVLRVTVCASLVVCSSARPLTKVAPFCSLRALRSPKFCVPAARRNSRLDALAGRCAPGY